MSRCKTSECAREAVHDGVCGMCLIRALGGHHGDSHDRLVNHALRALAAEVQRLDGEVDDLRRNKAPKKPFIRIGL